MDYLKSFDTHTKTNVNEKQGWSMRQVSGPAVHGFKAFLDGKDFESNPYEKEVEYKDWCSGYRNGKDATPEQIAMFKWIYSLS